MRRYCRIFYCDDVGERLCCASCRFRRDCGNPCLNHPSRCGLEDLREGGKGRTTPPPPPAAPPLAQGRQNGKEIVNDPREKGQG